MPEKRSLQAGPIGAAVAQNLEQLRESQNLSYAELSRRLTELGRPIAPLGLTRIRDGQRRVDVDDLVALALALDVSPATLLLPAETDGGRGHADLSVTEEGGDYARRQIWNWLTARAPIDEPLLLAPPSRSAVGFRLRAVPEGVDDFTRLLMSDEEKQKLREWVSAEGQENDGDD